MFRKKEQNARYSSNCSTVNLAFLAETSVITLKFWLSTTVHFFFASDFILTLANALDAISNDKTSAIEINFFILTSLLAAN
jgi:hypothetical protein